MSHAWPWILHVRYTGSMLAPGRTKMKMVSSNRSVAKGHLANGTSTHGATAPVSSGYGTGIEYLWLKIAAIGASGALFGYAAKLTNGIKLISYLHLSWFINSCTQLIWLNNSWTSMPGI